MTVLTSKVLERKSSLFGEYIDETFKTLYLKGGLSDGIEFCDGDESSSDVSDRGGRGWNGDLLELLLLLPFEPDRKRHLDAFNETLNPKSKINLEKDF